MEEAEAPKVRLELRKTGKKRRQHTPAAGFGSENLNQVETTKDDSKTPKEPLVIPAVANKSKFVSAARDNDDAIAAKALTEDLLADGGTYSGDKAIPVSANTSDQRNRKEGDSTDEHLYQKELETLPQELTETDDAYDRVPIADFGAALLRGMGWQGDESSKTKQDKEPALPRPHRLGLGAVPKPLEEISHRPLRPDEYEKRKKQRLQHEEFRAQHEKKRLADPQQTLQDGSLVYLVDSSVRARIVKLRGVPGLNRIQIQYERDREITSIQKSQVDRLISRQELIQRPFEEPPPTPDASLASSKFPEVSSSSNQRDTKPAKKKQRKSEEVSSMKKDEERSWLIPHIRVRVITKKLGKSHYKSKGVILDVTSKGATIQMADGSLLDRVPMRYVETALPKVGGSCIVVGRKHWQTKGRLLERNSDKAIIQESENGTALTIHLDDLAEWCGPDEDTNF